MKSAQYWVESLHLVSHPEGGFYKETYRATENISGNALPQRFAGDRSFSTAIYFLLRSGECSRFHRIKSDEIWHFHAGTALAIHVLKDNRHVIHKLGPNPEFGESLQVVIPANCWFGATVIQPDSYTLSGCTVAPGFDFQDFELADRKTLTILFPAFEEIIKKLT